MNVVWRGSACEAWINRESLAAKPRFETLLKHWQEQEATLPADHRSLKGNQRPANIYNGVLKPTIGYGIKGAIWYQGESNATRAYQYRDLFPFMIETWRKEWGQGDFPFLFVQKPSGGGCAFANDDPITRNGNGPVRLRNRSEPGTCRMTYSSGTDLIFMP